MYKFQKSCLKKNQDKIKYQCKKNMEPKRQLRISSVEFVEIESRLMWQIDVFTLDKNCDKVTNKKKNCSRTCYDIIIVSRKMNI